MSEKMFSEEQLEQLRSFPEISADELIRYFTSTAADAAFVSPGGRGPVDRLGVASAALRLYGRRDQTRSDHLDLIAKYLEWQSAPAGSQAMKELEQFLPDRAMEHNSPTLLFNLAHGT
ncbi:DUF4158 domain-containing protein [Streptosporangium algeriense]|uniref:DUF4158 domain-containing protein n=1 Tax=Streptosporangium algeriense TaxID=1682748 RepID=A0ABW3DVJ3_9ACTN